MIHSGSGNCWQLVLHLSECRQQIAFMQLNLPRNTLGVPIFAHLLGQALTRIRL